MGFQNQYALSSRYALEPGYIYLPEKPTLVASSLGSCVVVSIFDSKQRIGGLAQYMLPATRDPNHYTTMYGNVSIITLIRMFIARGSKSRHLEAQIFGGAHKRGSFSKNVGRENVMIARRILNRYGIRIVSEDIGGEKGRKIVFNSLTNEVAILKVNQIPSFQWYPYRN